MRGSRLAKLGPPPRTLGRATVAHEGLITRVREMEQLRPRDLSDFSDLSDASAVDLVKSALAEAKNLVALEVALARDDAKREIYAAKRAAIAAALSVSMLLVAIAVLLVSLALAIAPGAFPAFIIGLVVLGGPRSLLGSRRASCPKSRSTTRVNDWGPTSSS